MPYIQVFEHDRLTTNEDDFGRKLTPIQFEKLCQFNDKNDNLYFTVIRNGIKFAQYVGVIQIGNLTIEILPKADKETFTKSEFKFEAKKWQKVLMKMLAISGELELETVSDASLKKRTNLLDLYFNIYLNEIDKLMRKGLVKKYRHNSSNVKSLKGRLNFAKNIQQNLIHQERFFTTHQQYDHAHLLNQILLKGLLILNIVATDSFMRDKITKLLFFFPDMQEIPITREAFGQIRLTRKTSDYTKAINIAKMLILNYAPDITKGDENMLALLFDMNKLWEKYIYKKLKAKESDEMTVSYHDQDHFWEDKRIYPDVIIRNKKVRTDSEGNREEFWEPYVIDTKWKLIEANKPSDDDLKQMYVYNMYWNSPKSILLYPQYGQAVDSDFGKFHKGKNGLNHCKIAFVHVLDESGKLNGEIASQILLKLDDNSKPQRMKNEETLIEFLAEGGSIKIIRTNENNQLSFIIQTSEFDLDDNSYESKTVFPSFEEAYSFMYRKYPIKFLHLDHINPDLEETVEQLNKKFNQNEY